MSIGKTAPERSREVRLGLVIYGGVSLAVYENGVAQELFNAVKGEGVYGLVKALTDSDILVDILSGTSAGGINGIYLAYALSNGKDFRAMADLWREDGDILKLLRSPSDPNTASLLDSEGFYQPRLAHAFRSLPDYVPPDPDWPYRSEVQELDLFVTGTDANGDVYTVFDDQGHPIDVKNHLALFQLCYRQGRKNDFTDPNLPERGIQALAKLARLTSCFPAAFAPVHVKKEAADSTSPDSLLQRWGQLGREAYFLDGGVLNNKPFSSTIDAIYGRMADRDTKRILFYVEPDPERFEHNAEQEAPNVVRAAVDGVVSIPGYQSISADLQDIANRNTKVSEYETLVRCASQVGQYTPDCLKQSQTEALEKLKIDKPTLFEGYLRSRLSQIRDRTLERILNDHGKRGFFSPEENQAARELVDSFQEWRGDGLHTLEEFDVYFRLRRLYHVIYELRHKLYKAKEETHVRDNRKDDRKQLHEEVRHCLNHQLQVLEILRFNMEALVDEAELNWRALSQPQPKGLNAGRSWQEILAAAAAEPADALTPRQKQTDTATPASKMWATVRKAMRMLLDTEGIQIPEANPEDVDEEARRREQFAQDMRSRLAKVLKSIGQHHQPAKGNLLAECDRLEGKAIESLSGVNDDPAVAAYCCFVEIDALVFPASLISGTDARDIINTVRLSPVDARKGFSSPSLEEKLCGTALGHFGGFLARPWRSNDILWGRLDALCQILECLLTQERVAQVWSRIPPDPRLNCRRLFPHQSDNTLQSLQDALDRIPQLTEIQFAALVKGLIEAAQAEILVTAVPQVIQDAIRQQAEWNQYRVAKTNAAQFLPASQSWKTGTASVNPLVAAVNSQMIASQEPPGGWPEFFRREYRIASAGLLGSVPMPVLLEIGTTAALVLSNCLAASAGSRGTSWRSKAIYKLAFDWPLRFVNAMARFQRRAPEFSRTVQAVACFTAIVLLAAGVVWHHFLPNTTARWAVFVVIPIAMLLSQLAFVNLVRYRKSIVVLAWTGAFAFAAAFVSVIVAVILGQTGALSQHSIELFFSRLPMLAWAGTFLQRLADGGTAFWAGAAFAAALVIILRIAGGRRRSKLPGRRYLKRVLLECFSSEDLSSVAMLVKCPPPYNLTSDDKSRAALIEILIKTRSAIDLAQAIREIKPGVLPA
jgi:patatin-related protein